MAVDFLSVDQLNSILGPRVERLLLPLGFELQKPLHWVRSADAPIRQLYAFKQWKGAKLAPAWGLSLDFVPHQSGQKLKWHRTAKSALFDLSVDSRDQALDLSFIGGADAVEKSADAVVSKSVARAQAFWHSAATVGQLPVAFESLKRILASSSGLGFYNFTQHPIAYAFALALNGRREDAEDELEKYLCGSTLLEKEQKRLREMVAGAAVA